MSAVLSAIAIAFIGFTFGVILMAVMQMSGRDDDTDRINMIEEAGFAITVVKPETDPWDMEWALVRDGEVVGTMSPDLRTAIDSARSALNG